MDHATLFGLIASRREVVVDLADLGLRPALLFGPLIELAEAGLVECFGVSDEGGSACLTPLGASRAGLEPDRTSTRWEPAGARGRPTRRRASGTTTEADLIHSDRGGLDDMFDDMEPTPAQHAEIREAAGANPPKRRGDYRTRPLQEPTRLLGSTAIWPMPGQRGDDGLPRPSLAEVGEGRRDGRVTLYSGPCPGCGGREMDIGDYCLACQRSGQDHLLARDEAAITLKIARFKAKGRKAAGSKAG